MILGRHTTAEWAIMDRTRVTLLAAFLVGTSGCGVTREVEQLYIGGWIFLALIFIALVVLLALVVRYLAAGRKDTPQQTPVDTIKVEDTGDPNDWV